MEVSNLTHGNRRISINIRGTIYETFVATLERFPDTLLGSEYCRKSFYSSLRDELILDVDTMAFEAILFYYQSSGNLVRPPWLSMVDFEKECLYFQIDDSAIKKMKQREGLIVRNRLQKIKKYSFREKIWRFLEYPESSRPAQIYAILNVLVIIASIVLACVESVPGIATNLSSNVFENPMFLTEFCFQCIFALDFVLRFAFAPKKKKFMKSIQNVTDILAIFPYFIILLAIGNTGSSLAFLRVARTFRAFRLLHLTKQFDKLEKIMKIIKTCGDEMITFIQCLLVFCCLFGSLEYYSEYEVLDTQFVSIPEAMWWALQTVVCLGYGDIVPRSIQGKITGGIIAMLGAILLTVPVLYIGGQYLTKYCKTFSISLGHDFKATKYPKSSSQKKC